MLSILILRLASIWNAHEFIYDMDITIIIVSHYLQLPLWSL